MVKPQIKCTVLDAPLCGPWFAASLWFLSCDWSALCDTSLSNWFGSRWQGLKGREPLTLSYIKMTWQTVPLYQQHQDINRTRTSTEPGHQQHQDINSTRTSDQLLSDKDGQQTWWVYSDTCHWGCVIRHVLLLSWQFSCFIKISVVLKKLSVSLHTEVFSVDSPPLSLQQLFWFLIFYFSLLYFYWLFCLQTTCVVLHIDGLHNKMYIYLYLFYYHKETYKLNIFIFSIIHLFSLICFNVNSKYFMTYLTTALLTLLHITLKSSINMSFSL